MKTTTTLYVDPIMLVLLIGAGALAMYGGTAAYDDFTGTTLDERCEERRAVLADMEAQGAGESELDTYYRVFVRSVCRGTAE